MSVDSILATSNIYVMLAIVAVMEALKFTLKKLGLLEKKIFQALMPWLPLLLGVVAAFVPGALQAPEVGPRLMIGVALGGLSAHVYKIVKTKVDLLKGKL